MAFAVPPRWPRKPTLAVLAVLLVASQSHCDFPLELQNLCPTVTLSSAGRGPPFSIPEAVKYALWYLSAYGRDLAYCNLE